MLEEHIEINRKLGQQDSVSFGADAAAKGILCLWLLQSPGKMFLEDV